MVASTNVVRIELWDFIGSLIGLRVNRILFQTEKIRVSGGLPRCDIAGLFQVMDKRRSGIDVREHRSMPLGRNLHLQRCAVPTLRLDYRPTYLITAGSKSWLKKAPVGDIIRPLCIAPTLVSITTTTSVFSNQYIPAENPSVPPPCPSLV